MRTTLVKILKGELKEKGKGIPLSTAAEFLFLFPPLSLYRRDGKKGKDAGCILPIEKQRNGKEKKSLESLLKHVQKALNYLWQTSSPLR